MQCLISRPRRTSGSARSSQPKGFADYARSAETPSQAVRLVLIGAEHPDWGLRNGSDARRREENGTEPFRSTRVARQLCDPRRYIDR